jgi:hypothetical protein
MCVIQIFVNFSVSQNDLSECYSFQNFYKEIQLPTLNFIILFLPQRLCELDCYDIP